MSIVVVCSFVNFLSKTETSKPERLRPLFAEKSTYPAGGENGRCLMRELHRSGMKRGDGAGGRRPDERRSCDLWEVKKQDGTCGIKRKAGQTQSDRPHILWMKRFEQVYYLF